MEHQGPWQQIPFPGVSVSWTLSPPPLPPPSTPRQGLAVFLLELGYIRVVLRPSTILAPFRLSTLKVRVTWRNDLILNVLAERDSIRRVIKIQPDSRLISKRTITQYFDNFFLFYENMYAILSHTPRFPSKKQQWIIHFSELPYGLSHMSAFDYLLAEKATGKLTL